MTFAAWTTSERAMTTSSKKVDLEQWREENYRAAHEDWERLTAGKEEWPEEEHEARFEALMKKALFTKPNK